MGKANPTVLFGFFVAVIAAICGVSLMKGGFYLGKHEGDMFHTLQIVFRMVEGQRPHLDFMTPIGVLAFAPMAWLVTLGLGAGMAILWSQAIVSVLFLPAVWWVAITRMQGATRYLFGVVVFVLIGAVVHGESESSVSISMHYNRWAWAVSFILIAAAVLPVAQNRRHGADGAIIGIMLSVLALTKITYFAAFILPVVVALLMYRAYRTLAFAALWGLLAVILVTLWAGFDFWAAYLVDILRVSTSDNRAMPGETFSGVVGSPAYLGASLLLITGVILLRQGQQKIGGLVMLLLTPGFFFVAFQNFGNDPQWLQILAILLLAFPVAEGVKNSLGWDMRRAVTTTALLAMAMTAPSFFNLAYSPFRHLTTDVSEFTAFLPNSQRHGDIFGSKTRAMQTNTQSPVPGESTYFAHYSELADREDPTIFLGETFPRCQMTLGYTAWFQTVADELEQAGFAQGKSVFAADLLSSYWLFGSLEPVPMGAPWFYGGLPGIMNADYLLVPMCPIIPEVRHQVLENIEERELEYVEIHRTSLYVVYERSPSGA